MKRCANVPETGLALSWKVSKADLLEAAWSLASLCNEAGSAEDDESTFRRLLDELVALGRLSDAKRAALLAEQDEKGGSQ